MAPPARGGGDAPVQREPLRVGGLAYLGQVADTYLLLRDAEGALLLLDQHAAHERVLYARLEQGAFSGAGQCLALPLELDLQPVRRSASLPCVRVCSKWASRWRRAPDG